LGIKKPALVDAQPFQFSDQVGRDEALKRAYGELDSVAKEWLSK